MEQQALVYLGIVALVGLLLKFCILFNISIKSKVAEQFAIVCLLFLLHNVAEFLAYFTYLQSESLSMFFVHLYMVALYFIFPAVLLLALALIESRHLQMARYVLFGMAGLLSVAHASGLLISGFKYLGWTVITTPADYYWVAIAFIVANVLAALIVLVWNFLASADFEIRSRCKVNLLAFAPMILVVLGVVAARAAGFDSSAAVFLPVTTVFFLFVMLLQTNGNIFWASLRLKILLTVLTARNIQTLDDLLINIEKLRITEALKATNGKQTVAAELLKIPASTLNRKITKYGIEATEFRGQRLVQLGS